MCATFCMLFSFRFGPTHANGWLLAWVISTLISGLIIAPTAVSAAAMMKHTAVWTFANALAGDSALAIVGGAR